MGGIFSKPKAPAIPKPQPLPVYEPPPEPEPVPEMPVPDEEGARTDAEKKAALLAKRSGRASTVLTEDDEKLS